MSLLVETWEQEREESMLSCLAKPRCGGRMVMGLRTLAPLGPSVPDVQLLKDSPQLYLSHVPQLKTVGYDECLWAVHKPFRLPH